MHYQIGPSLKLICQTLQKNTERVNQCQRFEIAELLKTLNATEKLLVAKYFCKLPWNIGSLFVLGILHDLRILTATEFILCYNSNEDVQLVLNDFYESEFELITNLFINSTMDSGNSIRLSDILEVSLENLFKDLLEKPELNSLGYAKYMRSSVPGEILIKIIQKHVDVIIRLEQSGVSAAFENFSSWINEGVDELKFPKDLYDNLLSNNIEDSLNYLLKLASVENFRNWKFYLILLQTLCSGNNEKAGPYVRKHLKAHLKQLATLPYKRSMMNLLLTARASNAVTMDISKNLDLYADWYKNNIGEMKFFFKAEEFHNIMNLLDQCIAYEAELDYLEIHAAISISPPVLCGKIVQSYKSKCKQRLQQIKKGIKGVGIDESIVIEDSN
ncbi:uncharacterized protein LOC101891480 isoform X2 [Musca domestica]|uniref:Uncharacterized protein LOC101891480 isoform X2 n=1 Tax=Musca domestica TaxID=7370 RepID=A0A1I8N0Z2_MUSDO|nr:uncharacterized protein LOC101891480 isoform X2 [Musca domestica]